MGYSNQVLQSINTVKSLRSIAWKDVTITWTRHSLGGLLTNALAAGDYAITFNAVGLSNEVKGVWFIE